MVIQDRYQIIKQIGSGAMGVVYQAIDQQNQQVVAIKHLKAEALAMNPEIIERFQHEAQLLRKLNHPNIVRILNSFEVKDQHYLVMEYVERGSLAELLQREKRLSLSRSLKIALEIADALTRTHHLKVIHRDLKPANVLIDEEDVPYLTDFGMARSVNLKPDISADMIVGTPQYMSPESWKGLETDARADIWAFGVLLFEMLTGQAPFKEGSFGALVNAILSKPIPDLEKLRPDLPIAVIDLIYRMLDKDRDTRISSIRIVAAELENIQEGRAIAVRPSSSHEIQRIGQNKKHNLPAQSTMFVGRESEMDTVGQFLNDKSGRLMTILGPGGMGKSRLAIETALQHLPDFEEGCYFVALAPLTEAERIPLALADALGLKAQGSGDALKQQLFDYLEDRQMLLIFDNFEHLIEAAPFVSELLESAPKLKILATSRQKLALHAENILNLDGIQFPNWETPADVHEFGAVKLFMQTALRLQPKYNFTDADMMYIARICNLVQGMPLGILLAAGWMEILSPKEIADSVSKSFDFLETEASDLPARQRSIRAVFDYSWNLLSDEEREFFAKFSLFRDGASREAVQAVTGASLQALARIVNKSLLRRNADTGRYDIHELLRQYAAEKLSQRSDADTSRSAHSEYYLNLLAERGKFFKRDEQLEAIMEIERDFENVQAAWYWAGAQRNFNLMARAIEAMHMYTQGRSRFIEHHALFDFAREALKPRAGEEPQVVWAIALALHNRTVYGVIPLLQQAYAIVRQKGNKHDIAYVASQMGRSYIYHESDNEKSVEYLQESLAIFRELGDNFYISQTLIRLAFALSSLGRGEVFGDLIRESLAFSREINNHNGIALCLLNLGSWERGFGNYQQSIEYYLEGQRIYRHLRDLAFLCGLELELATLYFTVGQFDEAKALTGGIEAVAADLSDNLTKGSALVLRAWEKLFEENYEEALKLAEQSEPLLATNLSIVFMAYFGEAAALLGLGKFSESGAYIQLLIKSGITFHSVEIKLLTLTVLSLKTAQESPEKALEMLALFDTHPARLSGVMDKWALIDRLRQQLQTVSNYQAVWERGKALDLDTLLEQYQEREPSA
jgi:serine/threonine protein kinase